MPTRRQYVGSAGLPPAPPCSNPSARRRVVRHRKIASRRKQRRVDVSVAVSVVGVSPSGVRSRAPHAFLGVARQEVIQERSTHRGRRGSWFPGRAGRAHSRGGARRRPSPPEAPEWKDGASAQSRRGAPEAARHRVPQPPPSLCAPGLRAGTPPGTRRARRAPPPTPGKSRLPPRIGDRCASGKKRARIASSECLQYRSWEMRRATRAARGALSRPTSPAPTALSRAAAQRQQATIKMLRASARRSLPPARRALGAEDSQTCQGARQRGASPRYPAGRSALAR